MNMKDTMITNGESKDLSHPPVSLVVLTWNGKHLLEECLPSVVLAAESYPGQAEIVVVDNGSVDRSVEYLREAFPQVSLIPLHTNTGFPICSNTGIRAARHDLVFLLNNDMFLEPDCIVPLVNDFTNEKVFAVGPLMLFPKSEVAIYSCSGVRFSRGRLKEDWAVTADGVDRCGRPSPTLYVSGGAMMFRRHIFEELGMFDTLYNPFNCEDLDICYRAWKMGYHVLYEPGSIVYHKHQATIPKAFSRKYYAFINRRNKFLLMWRNLTDTGYFVRHIVLLIPHLFARILRGDTAELLAFLAALRRARQIAQRRRREKNAYVRSDAEICEMLALENLLSPDSMFESI